MQSWLYTVMLTETRLDTFLVCLWMHIVTSSEYPFTSTDHKFTVSGHSYHPDSGILVVLSNPRRILSYFIPGRLGMSEHKNPFTVRKMSRNDFVSLRKQS